MKFWFFSREGQAVTKTSGSLLDVVDLGEKEIISVIGGGGKTHTVFELCKELWASKSKRVVLCTSTHMMFPDGDVQVYQGENPEELEKLFETSFVVCGTKSGRRMSAPPQKLYDVLHTVCDYLVIEADGSRQLPLKFPQDHEPVLHPQSTLVLGLCGVDAYGQQLSAVCHRAPTAMAVLNKKETDIIDENDIAKTLEGKEFGQMKNVNCRFLPVVNKVDDDGKLEIAIKIAAALKENDCIFSTFR